MGFCSECGVHVPETAGRCPICGNSPAEKNGGDRTEPASSAPATAGERVAAAAAYFTPIVPLILLLSGRFRRSLLVRFHVLQSLLFHLALLLLALLVAAIILNWFSGMIVLIIWPLYGFAAFVLWLLLVVKAGQAELFQLPLLGGVARRGCSI